MANEPLQRPSTALMPVASHIADRAEALPACLSSVAAFLITAGELQKWLPFLYALGVMLIAVAIWFYNLWHQKHKHVEFLTQESALAEQAAECDRLRQENNHLNYDMIVLYQFVNNLGNCRSTTAVYNEFIATVQQSIEPDVSGLFVIDPENGGLYLAAHHGLDDLEEPAYEPAIKEGLVGWVAANGREVVVDDANTDLRFPELREAPFVPSFKAAIGLPLLFQNRTLGIAVIGRAEGSFNQDELRLLFIIANEGALYLQNLRLYEEVSTLAISDGSTGLYNHRYFFEQIDHQLAKARAENTNLSLLMIDIDNFKPFNDLYGHLTGDAILQEVAHLLKMAVGPKHLVARYGGEEFAVLMADTDSEAASRAAETIRECIAGHDFVTLDGRHARVTVSIGLATYPEHLRGTANTVTELIAAADYQLVMRAKNEGKNRVRFAKFV